VGDQPSLGPFVPDDSFLRHIDRPRHVTDDSLSWEVFKPREQEDSLSFTYQDSRLRTEEGLQAYQCDKALPFGDFPGICKLTFYDLSQRLEPPLPPRPDWDRADEKYGHLHCVTDCPTRQLHMEQMAKLATRNGLLCRFVRTRKKKRRRLTEP